VGGKLFLFAGYGWFKDSDGSGEEFWQVWFMSSYLSVDAAVCIDKGQGYIVDDWS
jgi:hypothetical protein